MFPSMFDNLINLIKNNQKVELEDRLNHYSRTILEEFSRITLEQTLEGLKQAITYRAFDCIPVLVNYAKKSNVQKFNHAFAPILMGAVKANHIDAVKALLSCCGDDRSIFYHHKTLVRDDHEKFTVLHWAVRNNNPAMCSLLLRKWNEKNLNILNDKGYLESSYNPEGLTFKLCTTHNDKKKSAFALAFDLGHLDCAKEIAKFYEWDVVRHTEDKESVIYQVLLNNFKFGYRNYQPTRLDILYENYYQGIRKLFKLILPSKRIDLNVTYPYTIIPSKLYDKDQSIYYLINRNKSNAERLLFLTEATSGYESALGNFYYEIIDPKLKKMMDADLLEITSIAPQNHAPVPDSEIAQLYLIEEIQQYLLEEGQVSLSLSEDENFESARFIERGSFELANIAIENHEQAPEPEPIIDSRSYSVHLQNYLSSFDDSKKISTQIAALKLTPEEKKLEEKLFKEFIDPISLDYIGIPVYLNEIWYDFKSICLLEKDPMTREKFSPLEIMAGRKILEKFDKAVKALQNARALGAGLADSNVTSFNLLAAPPTNSAETSAINEMIMKQAGLR